MAQWSEHWQLKRSLVPLQLSTFYEGLFVQVLNKFTKYVNFCLDRAMISVLKVRQHSTEILITQNTNDIHISRIGNELVNVVHPQ